MSDSLRIALDSLEVRNQTFQNLHTAQNRAEDARDYARAADILRLTTALLDWERGETDRLPVELRAFLPAR